MKDNLIKPLDFLNEQEVVCPVCHSNLVILTKEISVNELLKNGYPNNPLCENSLNIIVICPKCGLKPKFIINNNGKIELRDPDFDNSKHEQEMEYLIKHNNKETNGFGYYKE